MIYIWSSLCLLTCGLALWSQFKQQPTLSGLFKTLASLCFFIPALFYVISENPGSFAVLLTVAFGFSLAGDILLTKTTDKRFFMLGLLAFLCAHFVFAWSFINAGINRYELMSTSLVVAPAMIGCYVWLYRHLNGLMKLAVAAYLIAIGTMLITAMLTKHPAHTLITGGAVLFALSDLLVARQRFVSPGLQNRLIGLPLYYVAQLLFLSTLIK